MVYYIFYIIHLKLIIGDNVKIQTIIGNRYWSFGKNKSKKVEAPQSVEPTRTRVAYCLKCGCMLFPDETMCPDCLFPVRENKGWTA